MRFICFLLLLSSGVNALEREIRLGVHNFPPYFVMQSAGHCAGEAVDKTQAMLTQPDVTLVLVCATAARLYKMLESGEVDLTINIKQTKALPPDVSFVEPPFAQLSLMLITHGAAIAREKHPSIAAIRGFDYHGQRQLLTDKGYHFIDLPDSISAVEMFVKGRSSALITYQAPFSYYLQQHNLPLAKHYHQQLLENIDTFYVLSARSEHKDFIVNTLRKYATQEQVSYFSH